MIRNPVTTPSPANSAFDEYYQDTGIRLSHVFAGSSLDDQIGDITLSPVGTATSDEQVVDTLPLTTSHQWSHAYEFAAGGDSFDSDGTIDFGDGYMMVHVTAYGPHPISGLVDVVGNENSGATTGFVIQVNEDGDVVTSLRIGGVVLSVTGVFAPNTWWDACVIVDRESGQAGTVRLGTIDAQTSNAIGAGTLNSDPLAIGKGRTTSFLGQVMTVRIAFGAQLAGVSPMQLCQKSAQQIWWDQQFTRVESGAR